MSVKIAVFDGNAKDGASRDETFDLASNSIRSAVDITSCRHLWRVIVLRELLAAIDALSLDCPLECACE